MLRAKLISYLETAFPEAAKAPFQHPEQLAV